MAKRKPAPDMSAQMDEVEQEAPTPEDKDLSLIAVNTMSGDIRDWLLDRARHDHSLLPWDQRSEAEQERYIEAASNAAEGLIRRITTLIAGQDFPMLGAFIKKAAMKDVISVEAQVGLTHPLRHQLLDAVNSHVIIVLADVDHFMGQRAKAKINPDQKNMFPEDADPSANSNEPPDDDDTGEVEPDDKAA